MSSKFVGVVESMSLVSLAAKQQRIGMLWRGEQIDISITRGMFLGSSVRDGSGRAYSNDRAIDLIYRAYGSNLSVTKIMKKMRADEKIGGHPALRTATA